MRGKTGNTTDKSYNPDIVTNLMSGKIEGPKNAGYNPLIYEVKNRR